MRLVATGAALLGVLAAGCGEGAAQRPAQPTGEPVAERDPLLMAPSIAAETASSTGSAVYGVVVTEFGDPSPSEACGSCPGMPSNT